eukprot:COSAG03_NODE_25959_length_262_cov_0.705521_1_plen_22_part_01
MVHSRTVNRSNLGFFQAEDGIR